MANQPESSDSDVVRDVAMYFPTAIVTGRCIDKVKSFLKLEELYYAGSHGMDIKGPSNGDRAMGDFARQSPNSIILLDKASISVKELISMLGFEFSGDLSLAKKLSDFSNLSIHGEFLEINWGESFV